MNIFVEICVYFKMKKSSNTSFRNTFCNVAVDYELVAFWRYFIIRSFYRTQVNLGSDLWVRMSVPTPPL